MGIQINGSNDTISAADGGLVISGSQIDNANLVLSENLKVSGIGTFGNGLNVTGGSVGIGTDAPAEDVHIQKSIADVLIEGTNDTVGGNVANLSLMAPYYRKVGYSIKDSGGNEDFFIGRPYGQADANPDLVINMTGTEKVRIRNSGNVGIGTNNPSKPLQVHSDSASAVLVTGATPQIRFNSNVGDGTDADRVILGRASGNNQFITGSVDGDAILRCGTSKKVMIGYGTTEIAQFNSSGLKFKTSGMGIDFSATSDAGGMTSELLDDYEEGTFTPSFTGGTSGSGYTRQVGEYTKVGRLVTFTLTIDGDGGLSGAAAAIEIGGLPFTSRNVSEIGGAQITYPGDFDTTNDRRFWLVAQNNTTLSYRSATAAQINGNLVNNINSQLNLCGYYFTDA